MLVSELPIKRRAEGISVYSRSQSICIWGGPATLLCFSLAMLPAAHFIPPLSPLMTGAELVELFRGNATGIRIAAILLMFSVAFFMTYTAAISAIIKRIEGSVAPLAYVQLAGGVIALFPFLIVAVLWTCAAYRPERSPEMTQTLNDLAWMFLVIPAPSGALQPIATTIAILSDENRPTVLPRWVGYFNIWVAILFLPGSLAGMFKTGPFAWNGLLAFWLPAVVFGVYMITMCVVMFKANKASAASS
jgi:hypothetical protein